MGGMATAFLWRACSSRACSGSCWRNKAIALAASFLLVADKNDACAGGRPSFCISLIAAGLLLLGRQCEVALSLAAGLGTAVNRSLGTPHNPGQLTVVLMALPVGCLQLAV